MNFGYSIDELIQRNDAKVQAKRQKAKERKKTRKEEPKSTEKEQIVEQSEPKRIKKPKLSNQQRTILLDRANTSELQEMPKIEEKELKEVLKIVVKIMNTIPYEPVPINKHQEDGNPHARSKGENHIRMRDRKRPNSGKPSKTPQPPHSYENHKRQKR